MHIDGKNHGPYVGHEVRKLVEQGKIIETDLVVSVGGTAWIPADADPVLQTLFRARAPTVLAPDQRSPASVQGFREVRGRLSFFGWFWRVLFFGWQALMIAWLISYSSSVSPLVEGAKTGAEKAGAGIGITIAFSLIMFFWVGGSVILGLPVLFTRRARSFILKEDRR